MPPLLRALLVAVISTAVLAAAQPEDRPFSVVEASIAGMQAAMNAGQTTSRQIVEEYFARIRRYDELLRASLAINSKALEQADALDRERAAGRVRGPLHGVPVAVKDNIQTTEMPTTGGTLAFRGFVPPYEATLVRRLREAGAIVIAKTGMTELGNWMAGLPTPMPSGYNAIHGFGRNPFDPRLDPRPLAGGEPVMSPGGSSSGVGTSANLWAANVGTETSGSIINPASQTLLAAVKPTVGRISRYGIMPLAAEQDTPGPMAKYVSDVAIMLGAMEGTSPDPNDAATKACTPPPGNDYTRFLRAGGLRGARIGIPRAYYYEAVLLPDRTLAGGLTAASRQLMTDAIRILREQGAVVVDPANVPSASARTANDNVVLWESCWGADRSRLRDSGCSIVLKYGMKRDFNKWLATLGGSAPVRSLTALREWNIAHAKEGSMRFNQSSLDISDEMDVERDRARFEADRARDVRLSVDEGLGAALSANKLDALLFPDTMGASIAARAGYPTVMVPLGFVDGGIAPPAPGFDPRPQPFGVGFTGTACSEPKLLEIAYAFEQATKRRIAPDLELQ
ncbi:MAG: amidase family protein [Vicinamibacterales bacterium]